MSEILERAPARPADDTLRIIDCDVHPIIRGGLGGLGAYMPNAWRQRFIRNRAAMTAETRPLRFLHPNGPVAREDAASPAGEGAGVSPHWTVEDLIDRQGIEVAVLNSLQIGAFCATLAGTEESIVINQAGNDYFINEWLTVDPRLRLAMTIPSQDPQACVEEIRRIGAHKQIAAIYLPPINILLGNRYWYPVYEAAQEMGLPILLHVTGTDSIYYNVPMSAGGFPETYVERYVTLNQGAESNLNSLVFNGIFERFPRLKFIFAEYGFLWVHSLLLRMERTWRQLRHDTPWVKRSPFEYVRESVKFSTQPLEEPDNPRDLETLINMMGPEMLCFSTDYPHWDNDMPGRALLMLPKETRRRIFYQNAAETLRLG